MLRALLFDDEYIVLEGLQAIIDWNSFGIEIAGTAQDGPSALRLIYSENPDIILTDIRMPGMDGLQLIHSVVDKIPDIYCIVFSGFNEYEYVKRAIQLGVSDYLEKPLEVEKIEEALHKAIAWISQHAETKEIKRDHEQSKNVLLEKMTIELLAGRLHNLPKWNEFLGIQTDLWEGITVLACSEQMMLTSRPDCHSLMVHDGDQCLIIILHLTLPAQDLWDEIDHEAVRRNITVGCSCTKKDLTQMPEVYHEALRALRCGRFLEQTGMVRFLDLGGLITDLEPLSDKEEAIILSLRTGNYAGVMEHLQPFMEWIQSELVAPEIVEREMLKLLYLALETAKEGHLLNTNDQLIPHIAIQKILGREQMLIWFREQFEQIVRSALEVRENTKLMTVSQAKLYIEDHISQDLSLQEVADYVGMNPSYLSVLFKEVTGETYIRYVTRFRMELAKKWLSSGLKVSEVSEKVGYHTYRHFSEVFKKYTGAAPGQFKERLEASLLKPKKNVHESMKSEDYF
ncbi:putative response regulatory protein [compost metagenome]